MKQVTVYDIAKEANVSVATVSRVLNGTAPVRASTKEKIQSIIDKHQFQPNALARSLLKKETGMIGIIMPDISNPFFPDVFTGAEQEARKMGSTLFLGDSMGDHARESEYLSAMREKQVDGIIFMGGRVNLRRCAPNLAKEVIELSERLPIVLVNGELPQSKLPRVATDEYAGAELAANHLIALGHRDIGFIGGDMQFTTTAIKVKAFKKVLTAHGIAPHPDWILHQDGFSVESGKMLMSRLLQLPSRPTAICCVNDFTAIGALKVALEYGLQVPGDLSIIGFDDTPLATAVSPELTTVSQHAVELGRTAVQVLQNLISKEGKVNNNTVLDPKLVVRQSTGPARI